MHFLIPVGLSNKIASYFVNLPPISNETYNKVFATNSFLIHFISIFFTSMLVISLLHPVIKKLWHDIRNRTTPKWLLIICLVRVEPINWASQFSFLIYDPMPCFLIFSFSFSFLKHDISLLSRKSLSSST